MSIKKSCKRCKKLYEAKTNSKYCQQCRKPAKVENEKKRRHESEDYRRRREISRNKWLKKNPEKRREYWQRWYRKNRSAQCERGRKWYWENRKKARAKREKQKLKGWGLTIEDYEKMLKKQNGVCAICKQKCNSGRKLAIDHDHKTGKIRGLLCGSCNLAIGKFNDDVELLKEAIKYIERR